MLEQGSYSRESAALCVPEDRMAVPSVLKLRGHTEADDARIAAAQDARIAKQEGASEACFTSIKPFDHHSLFNLVLLTGIWMSS